jgi:filamentous hemagglutinin
LVGGGVGAVIGSQGAKKSNSSTTSETATTNTLSSITAGGNLTVVSGGATKIAGADLSATTGTTTLVGQSVSITGVIDSASFDSTTVAKKSGFLSSKKTTTTSSSDTQAVVASTVSGDRVNVIATGGDISVKGSNIVSDNGTLLQATGAITIGTLEAKSSESQSVKVKKSGISISGAGLFAGVAKSTNAGVDL